MTSIVKDTYDAVLADVIDLLEDARRTSARVVNSVMTATYWIVGRRIVEHEQHGKNRAGYGEELLERLAVDLTNRFGRGFSRRNLQDMRTFYLYYPKERIWQSVIAKSKSRADISIRQSLPAKSGKKTKIGQSAIGQSPTMKDLADALPLPWTHYARLLRVRNIHARVFYEIEALRGGWSTRQLERQINSQSYERTALSRNKAAMLTKGSQPQSGDAVSADDEVRNPLVLEFLGLKDEYSESNLEEALILHLETFLLELGGAFTFVGRQRRLRIDHDWFRVDLLFFHRRLRSLLVIDLKTGPLSHADIGQMHLYLNYAKEHWVEPGENPPVGLILCTEKGESLAHYALEGLPNKTLVREYLTLLPDEKLLVAEIEKTRKWLEGKMVSKSRVTGNIRAIRGVQKNHPTSKSSRPKKPGG
jgi:predicted nuclease of restriction endonuclease-like (RecB) superfamily